MYITPATVFDGPPPRTALARWGGIHTLPCEQTSASFELWYYSLDKKAEIL
jgi:hypothetical protein